MTTVQGSGPWALHLTGRARASQPDTDLNILIGRVTSWRNINWGVTRAGIKTNSICDTHSASLESDANFISRFQSLRSKTIRAARIPMMRAKENAATQVDFSRIILSSNKLIVSRAANYTFGFRRYLAASSIVWCVIDNNNTRSSRGINNSQAVQMSRYKHKSDVLILAK